MSEDKIQVVMKRMLNLVFAPDLKAELEARAKVSIPQVSVIDISMLQAFTVRDNKFDNLRISSVDVLAAMENYEKKHGVKLPKLDDRNNVYIPR